MKTETNILLVSNSVADKQVLNTLLAKRKDSAHVQLRAAANAPEFYDALNGEQPLRMIVLDARIAWSDWRAVVELCLTQRVDAMLVLLADGQAADFGEDALDHGVVAVYPRNSAGMLALSRLVARLGAAEGEFSLRGGPPELGDGQDAEQDERQALLYAVSHDLQDPLQLAKRYADMLTEDLDGQLGDTGAKVLENLSFNLGRTQEMLDELLEYSRLRGQAPTFETVDLDALLDEVLGLYQVSLDEIGASVRRRQPLPTLSVDRTQFHRLFQNLIGNAIKFRGDQRLRLAVRAQHIKKEWRIGIKDNGLGIEPGESKRIFDMFERGKSAGDLPGTGMGLAICKRIVQNHGGKLWVRSGEGGGSIFIFSIPDR